MNEAGTIWVAQHPTAVHRHTLSSKNNFYTFVFLMFLTVMFNFYNLNLASQFCFQLFSWCNCYPECQIERDLIPF